MICRRPICSPRRQNRPPTPLSYRSYHDKFISSVREVTFS